MTWAASKYGPGGTKPQQDNESGAHRILTKEMSDGSKLQIDPSQTAQDQAAVEALYDQVQKDFGKKLATDVTVLSVESIQLVDAQGKVTDSHGMLFSDGKVLIARTLISAGQEVSSVQQQATIFHEVMHEQHRRNLGINSHDYGQKLSNRTHLEFHKLDQQYVKYLQGAGSLPRIPHKFRN